VNLLIRWIRGSFPVREMAILFDCYVLFCTYTKGFKIEERNAHLSYLQNASFAKDREGWGGRLIGATFRCFRSHGALCPCQC
jgi:hypothetical protein